MLVACYILCRCGTPLKAIISCGIGDQLVRVGVRQHNDERGAGVSVFSKPRHWRGGLELERQQNYDTLESK